MRKGFFISASSFGPESERGAPEQRERQPSFPLWLFESGAQSSAAAINGKDPVERIKRLMQLCRDKPPP
jgi:hypothetical protein